MKKLAFSLLFFVSIVANAQVYRCGNEYRSTPCNDNNGQQVRLYMVQPPASGRVPLVPVYHCKSYEGAYFWSETHCSKRRATVDRTVNVPADLDWSVKLSMARQVYNKQTSEQRQRTVRNVHQTQQRTNNCGWIASSLRDVDSRARAGGSASYMESLNEERRRLLRKQSECR
uniref:DUF4124 domain-containing protein n=1 Tax=Dulem virus 61 TaxID=3145772 RepID=A0AAU8BAV5_9VIRU